MIVDCMGLLCLSHVISFYVIILYLGFIPVSGWGLPSTYYSATLIRVSRFSKFKVWSNSGLWITAWKTPEYIVLNGYFRSCTKDTCISKFLHVLPCFLFSCVLFGDLTIQVLWKMAKFCSQLLHPSEMEMLVWQVHMSAFSNTLLVVKCLVLVFMMPLKCQHHKKALIIVS
jgi:hypothetical protein